MILKLILEPSCGYTSVLTYFVGIPHGQEVNGFKE
jgi:hypothetical protein